MSGALLVIEDDAATARLVEYTLTRQGYEVITAGDGLEGLNKAREERPALVILDVMLPGIDGFELCHRLRSDPATAGIRILMFSARAQEADRESGLHAGADAYLTKPASPEAIVRTVRGLLKGDAG